jgi:hypothetical protein
MELMDIKRLNPKTNVKAKRSFSNREPLTGNVPKARIMERIPFGSMGYFSEVYKGRMEGVEKPVALKMSIYSNAESKKMWEEELEKSIKLSSLLPNTASYYSMVKVRNQQKFPAFAMEIVLGYPIVDMNLSCIDAGRFRNLLNKESVNQLAKSLEIAASDGWYTRDLQYFVLFENQTLNGKNHKKGDLILFDFWDWHQTTEDPRPYFDSRVKKLEKVIEEIEKINAKEKN